MRKTILTSAIFLVLVMGIAISSLGFASAQENTVCCQQTNTGAFCQDVPAEECAQGSPQAQTSCDATSFCRVGTCFDSNEGICMDNTPQVVCNAEGGIWSEESPPQCDLGCCILGDQAAFVPLVRCKKLSGFLGLQTNFKADITNELSCIAQVQAQDKGACVYDFEFESTCKFTTRDECSQTEGGSFFKDKLCSAEELGTICGPTTDTTTIPGKDEVYYVDTCGNPANIYDASKARDTEYWTNVKSKAESCNPSGSNALSASCGNCNYLLGTFARDKGSVGKNPTYGDYICADLNCEDGEGNARRHGESWCVNDDKIGTDKGDNAVGSGFFKHICINGEVVLEACSDFRAEECIENVIETNAGPFSQAACRVNRWQDCIAQTDQLDCENSDRRDCFWQEGITLGDESAGGLCLPQNSPGLKFWEDAEAQQVCATGNIACVVTFEKGLFGGSECKENCHCLEEGWRESYENVCNALGDCGPQINWVNKPGFRDAVDKIAERLRRQD